MERSNKNGNKQSGMVSQLLLFIVLIMMANAAIFTPNISALRENRRNIDVMNDEKLLRVIASSAARGSTINSNDIPVPLGALNPETGAPMSGYLNSDSVGGRLPTNYLNIAPTEMRTKFRYCPYNIGGSAVGGYVQNANNTTIALTVIYNENNESDETRLRCDQALSGDVGENTTSKYINISATAAVAMIRSSQTERSAELEQNASCPAGEEMIFIPEHIDEDTSTTVPSRFECQRNLIGMAATPGSGDSSNCGAQNAINLRGTETNGVGCADIAVRRAEVNTQTYDNVNNQIVSMYDIDEFFDAVSPINPDGSFRNIPGLAEFDCPQRYDDPHPLFPGPRSKAVVVLRDGSLICVGAWTILNSRSSATYGQPPCPEGKKIVWDATLPNSASFVCEGIAANDPTYGRWNRSCGLDNDHDGDPTNDQVFGYSPNTNRFYCYMGSTVVAQRDHSYTYPIRSTTACVANSVVTYDGTTVDCSQTYPNRLHTTVRALTNYHTNWAMNWDPATKSFVPVNPGTVKYPVDAPNMSVEAPSPGVDGVTPTTINCTVNGKSGTVSPTTGTCVVNVTNTVGSDD